MISLRPILLLCPLMMMGQTIKGKTNPVSVDYSQKEVATSPRKYRALIMGVSKYQHEGSGLQSLDNPAKDAQSVYDMLTKKYTFEPQDIILLKNPKRQNVIDAFDRLSNEAGANDNVLVFYAGHGVWDKQKDLGYWLPADAEMNSRSAWIANSQIKDYLSDNVTQSKHIWLITDACFGGSKKLGDNEDDYLPGQQLFSRIYEPIVNNAATNPVYGVIQGAGDGGGDFIFVKRKP